MGKGEKVYYYEHLYFISKHSINNIVSIKLKSQKYFEKSGDFCAKNVGNQRTIQYAFTNLIRISLK